jgi:hypothetical protein
MVGVCEHDMPVAHESLNFHALLKKPLLETRWVDLPLKEVLGVGTSLVAMSPRLVAMSPRLVVKKSVPSETDRHRTHQWKSFHQFPHFGANEGTVFFGNGQKE